MKGKNISSRKNKANKCNHTKSDFMEGKICQSCGMPLKEEQDFGTNKGRSKNNMYCWFCFQNGKFRMKA